MSDDDERGQKGSFLKSSQPPPSFSNTRAVEIHAKPALMQ